jgi:uptake hydrogenase large subunit
MRLGTVGIEGQLWIALDCAVGQVRAVRIRSSRPVQAARVLQGRAVGEALALLPRLFTLCGTAQACAGVRACEQALALQASGPLEQVRDLLVGQETLREHLRQVLFDWPPLLDEPSHTEEIGRLRGLQQALRRAVTAGRDPFRCAGNETWPEDLPVQAWGLLEDMTMRVGQTVFGLSPARWLAVESLPELEAWAGSGRTLVARLLDRLLREGWSGLGRCGVKGLPELEEGLLHELLQADDAVEHPQWRGECRETGCLTRVGSPLLVQLQGQFGNGLLVRWVARLTELARLAANPWPAARMGSHAGHNPGIGQAAAARGLLVHRVALEADRIVRYQVLAPTEWNFHQEGVVAQALASLEGDRALIERQARLLINAIDPCVGYALTISVKVT